MEEEQKTHIDSLEISVRLYNFLSQNSIYHFEDLAKHSSLQLLKMRNCGKKLVNQIRELLREHDLCLLDDILITDDEHKKFIMNVPKVLTQTAVEIEKIKNSLQYVTNQIEHIILQLEKK